MGCYLSYYGNINKKIQCGGGMTLLYIGERHFVFQVHIGTLLPRGTSS